MENEQQLYTYYKFACSAEDQNGLLKGLMTLWIPYWNRAPFTVDSLCVKGCSQKNPTSVGRCLHCDCAELERFSDNACQTHIRFWVSFLAPWCEEPRKTQHLCLQIPQGWLIRTPGCSSLEHLESNDLVLFLALQELFIAYFCVWSNATVTTR